MSVTANSVSIIVPTLNEAENIAPRAGGSSSGDGCGPQSSAGTDEGFARPAVYRHSGHGDRKSIRHRWVDAGLAVLATNHIASGSGGRLSPHRRARFDVRILCHYPFSIAPTGDTG